ncbi:unnamed protein product, partial [Haemonchus placei]|uniref:ZM domain-containing protein n=1 Tax=Haemonchus placei TaxID=6290 RepID=A0A0N4X2N3_HAEPC
MLIITGNGITSSAGMAFSRPSLPPFITCYHFLSSTALSATTYYKTTVPQENVAGSKGNFQSADGDNKQSKESKESTESKSKEKDFKLARTQESAEKIHQDALPSGWLGPAGLPPAEGYDMGEVKRYVEENRSLVKTDLRSVRDLKFEYNPKAPIGDVRNSPVPGAQPSPKPGPKLLEEQKTQVMSTVMIDDEINAVAVDRTPVPSLRSLEEDRFLYNPRNPLGDVKKGRNIPPGRGDEWKEIPKYPTNLFDNERKHIKFLLGVAPLLTKQQEPQEPLRVAAGNPSEKQLKDDSMKIVSQHFQQRQEANEAKQEMSAKYPRDIVV